jgi:putative DNA topoisomerase
MKTLIMFFVTALAAYSTFAQKSKANTTDIKPSVVTVLYACPMHPDMVSNKPGKCAKCSMDLSLSKKEQMKREVTKNYSCPMHQEVVSTHEGICAKCSAKLVANRRGSKQGTSVYTCSMHPNVSNNKDGKCPICGMALETKSNPSPSKSKM